MKKQLKQKKEWKAPEIKKLSFKNTLGGGVLSEEVFNSDPAS